MKVTVIGAGNGGRAYAAYLANLGIKVDLVFRTISNLSSIYRTHTIVSRGKIDNIVRIHRVTNDYSLALRNAKIILVVLPASVHKKVAEDIAPFLQEDQIILLNPGRTWGAIEFKNTIKRINPYVNVYVGETQTLLFTSRKIEDFGVEIYEIKKQVQYCFYPETCNMIVKPIIHRIFPQLYPVDDIRITSLNNIGMILHPVITLLNAARIENGKKFYFYRDGVSPSVACVLKELDKERLQIMERLGICAHSMLEWGYYSYGVRSDDYYELFQNIEAYKTILAPSTLNHRYLTEDIPTGLVAFSSLGTYLKVPTPTIDSLIQLGNVILHRDFMKEGRTVENCKVPIELICPSELESENYSFVDSNTMDFF